MLISPAYAQAGGGGGDMLTGLLPIVLIFVVFYFLLIRPQQKKAKAHRELVAALRRGDRVVTAGGIMGVVARVSNEHEVLVEIAEGVRVRMVRSQITEVLSKPGQAETAQPANDGAAAGGAGGLFGRFGKGS